MQGVVAGVVVWFTLLTLLASIVKRGEGTLATARAILGGETELAWDAFVWALLVVCIVAGLLGFLSNGYHVFGTDATGNDVLYRTLKSMRTALLFGTPASTFGFTAATAVPGGVPLVRAALDGRACSEPRLHYDSWG